MSSAKDKAIQDINAAKSLMGAAITKAQKAVGEVRAVSLSGGKRRRRTGKKGKSKK
jgi:hypothetical protein